MKQKHYRLIRTDGTEESFDHELPWRELKRLMGCTGLDYVVLDRRADTVMYVDDTGMLDGKPVNEKATKLYHARCLPGTVHQIQGHVVIVNDKGQRGSSKKC